MPFTTISITDFEAKSQVGGCVQSQPYIGNHVAESDASHFSDTEKRLMNVVDALRLRIKPETHSVGFWNGHELLPGGQGLRLRRGC
jgi:hypothetical protein